MHKWTTPAVIYEGIAVITFLSFAELREYHEHVPRVGFRRSLQYCCLCGWQMNSEWGKRICACLAASIKHGAWYSFARKTNRYSLDQPWSQPWTFSHADFPLLVCPPVGIYINKRFYRRVRGQWIKKTTLGVPFWTATGSIKNHVYLVCQIVQISGIGPVLCSSELLLNNECNLTSRVTD